MFVAASAITPLIVSTQGIHLPEQLVDALHPSQHHGPSRQLQYHRYTTSWYWPPRTGLDNSDAEPDKNGILTSPATKASSFFAVRGVPANSYPYGGIGNY
jgi:hypothetical protein